MQLLLLLLLLLLFGLWVMADDRFEPCVVPSIYFQQLFLLLAAAAAAAAAVGAALWTLPDRQKPTNNYSIVATMK
jgi:hypothetical protein